MYIKEECPVRRVVMDTLLTTMAGGESSTARQLWQQVGEWDITVPKKLVDSIRFGEKQRYATWTRKYSNIRCALLKPHRRIHYGTGLTELIFSVN